MKFKVGDRVKSAATSGDVKLMKATWNAVIHRVISNPNNSGGCYETVGTWNRGTNTSKNNEPNAKPTSRQLWGIHLESV